MLNIVELVQRALVKSHILCRFSSLSISFYVLIYRCPGYHLLKVVFEWFRDVTFITLVVKALETRGNYYVIVLLRHNLFCDFLLILFFLDLLVFFVIKILLHLQIALDRIYPLFAILSSCVVQVLHIFLNVRLILLLIWDFLML